MSPVKLFSWFFEKHYDGRVFLVRLFESTASDHVGLEGSRRYPELIWHSAEINSTAL